MEYRKRATDASDNSEKSTSPDLGEAQEALLDASHERSAHSNEREGRGRASNALDDLGSSYYFFVTTTRKVVTSLESRVSTRLLQ
ncbi:hypothetical protein ACOMHN_032526 [Nucella lapillus]